MPVATPFTSFGSISFTNPSAALFTGFPDCLDELDVTSYEWWTTFSGVNKNNPVTSDKLIQESLVLAMKLYWNGYSLDALSDGTYNGSPFTVEDIDVSSSTYNEPKSRACGTAYEDLSDNDPDGSANLSLRFFKPKKMMYDGDFVGYGYSEWQRLASSDTRTSGNGTRVYLLGSVETEDVPGSNEEIDYAYVKLNEISFVCEARAFTQLASASRVADASNMTATVSYSGIYTVDLESTITPDSLDFYTYPA